MIFTRRPQITILLIGDILLFYATIVFTLLLRYGLKLPLDPNIQMPLTIAWDIHKWPFFYIHLIWIAIFYINGLYDIKSFPSPKSVLSKVLQTMAIGAMLAVVIFYFVPYFAITPKTNLFIDVIILTLLLMIWRRFFWIFTSKAYKTNILFFGISKETQDFSHYLEANVQLGYRPFMINEANRNDLAAAIKNNNIHLIVASKKAMENEYAIKNLYEILPLGVRIVDFTSFYEAVAEKVPISVINESWFLLNSIEIHKKIFEVFKRIFDVVLAIILSVPTLIIFPFIAVLSKIESRDNILVRQTRVGKNGKLFILIKFRSMYNAAETDGKVKWTSEKDARITKIGRILRKTKIDELPQIWNIIKGEMSFIGPRPERPEFVEQLQKQIPHYAMRHLVKPGVSGWAQIKFPYGSATVEDTMEKLQCDFYYIKNRSVVLDAAIALRTIAILLRRQGR